ncbi:alpha/beta fold hydrolase, partial [Streptomyces sp. NPDC002156]
DNCHQPVAFHQTINTLIADGHHTFIETSAHPVLAPHLGDTDAAARILTSLHRDDGTAARFLTGLARAWTLGHPVTPTPQDGPTADLPTYPFQHRTYWISTTAPGPAAAPADTTEARFWQTVEEGAPDQVAGMLGTRDDATLADLVPALAAWRRERRTRSRAESWRYRLDWRPVTLPETALRGAWLAVLPPDGGGEAENAVLSAVEQAGARVVRVRARGKRDELAAALREGAGQSQPAGTLSLLTDTESCLVLLQALADARLGGRTWFLTRAAVSTGDSDPIRHPERAELWGLGRVAALEYPDSWGGLIDIPATPSTPDELAALPRILGGRGDEDQLAVRGAGTFACRLVPAPPPDRPAAATFRPHGTVLVTGATSPTALAVARWLAENGAQHLLLLTTTPAAGLPTPAELSGLGADITLAQCAPADRETLARLLDAIPADAPLTAVVHTDELLDEGPIETFTPERLQAVLAAKATTARHLHELTKDHDLAAFVLFSSFTASLGGGVGLGPYAAANAHLDALAAHRRALGLPATSLGWTAWTHAGRDAEEAAFENSRRQRLTQRGLPGLDPGLALLALQEAVERQDSALVVADVDWERFLHRYTATRPSPLLETIPQAARLRQHTAAGTNGANGAKTAHGAATTPQRLAALPAAEREPALLDLVRAQAAAVLGHTSGQAVDPRRGLLELGMDSLTTLELRNRLATATGLLLPPDAVFRNGSAEAIAQHLCTQLPQSAQAATAPPRPPSGPHGLAALFPQALDTGTTVEFTDLLGDAARFRPTLPTTMPQPVRLAEGPGGPALFCLPTVLASSGPHQFARFAAHFAGERDVWALPLPGYLPGEALPATLDALLDAAAVTIRRHCGGRPYALVGYSSGGLLAQAVAARLEDTGQGPAAVAAIDTSPLSRHLLVQLIPQLLDRLGKLNGTDEAGLVLDDDRLTAMGAYLRLLTDMTPPPVKARTLLLRAGTDIPGDHFSVIEAHAATTARSIHDWLDATRSQTHE